MNDKKTVTTRSWIEENIPVIESDIESSQRWLEEKKNEVDELVRVRGGNPEASLERKEENASGLDDEGEKLLERYDRTQKKVENLRRRVDELRGLIEGNSDEFVELSGWQWLALYRYDYQPYDPFEEKREKCKKLKEKLGNYAFYASVIAIFYFIGATGFGWLMIGLGVLGATMFVSMAIKAEAGGVPSGVILVPIIMLLVSGAVLIGVDALLSMF